MKGLKLLLTSLYITSVSAQISVLANAISNAFNQVQGILNTFKTSSKDTLLHELTNQGYKTFMDKTDTQIATVNDKYWEPFTIHMSMNMNIPFNQITAFQNYINDIKYTSLDNWSNIQASFSINSGGTMNYIMICTQYIAENNTHFWVHANVQGSFTLMSNIFVISHQHISFFSDKTTIELIEKPAGLKLEDFEPFFAFMKVIAFKQIGSYIGLDLQLK
jgi:ribosomal protein S8